MTRTGLTLDYSLSNFVVNDGSPLSIVSDQGLAIKDYGQVNSVILTATDINEITISGNLVLGGNLNLEENQATSFRIENVSSNPSAGNAGRLIWNTTTQLFEIDDGTIFQSLVFSGTNNFTGNQNLAGYNITNVGTLTVNTIQASPNDTNLTLEPSGTATQVVIPGGNQLTVDSITSSSPSTDLTLSSTSSDITIAPGNSFKISGATTGAIPYFNSNAELVTTLTGTSSQVLIGGTTPSFGSVTSSMVNSSIIVAAGTNAFTGNISFGENQAVAFRVENLSSAPAAGNAGRLIWNTGSTNVQVDNGTAFVSLATLDTSGHLLIDEILPDTSNGTIVFKSDGGISVQATDGTEGVQIRTLHVNTTNATPAQMTFDGNTASMSNIPVLATSSSHLYSILIKGRDTTNGIGIAAFKLEAYLDRSSGGTTSLLGSQLKTVIYRSNVSLDANITADVTNNGLNLSVTGLASTNIIWIAEISEIP